MAIDIDEEVKEKIFSFSRNFVAISSKGYFVTKENLHITIKFLGNIDASALSLIMDKISAEKIVAEEVDLKGIGFFPSACDAKVFWTGVHTDQWITDLFKSADSIASEFGVKKETRRFHPHVTLARFKEQPTRTFMDEALLYENISFGSFLPKELSLYESVLSTSGAVYKLITKMPFS
ncbi:MAG TPA: RNA 2',3'-cyclic phosphodiesterase [Treponemataceae bacterium]|nr:RNA 2',3'-cyclic phosphodiesterase [Treponemataceae bacterium]